MKKIVALVLALALALSLCTVAFAQEVTTLTAKDYKLLNEKNEDVTGTMTSLVAYSQVVTSSTTDGKTTTKTTPAYYLYNGTDKLVVVDSSNYNFKLVKDSKVVAYVAVMANVPEVEDVVTKVFDGVDNEDKTCGDYLNVGDAETYFVIDGDVYYQAADFAATNGFALLNGNLVAYNKTAVTDNATYLVKHDFDYDKVNYTDNTGKTVAAIYCKTCKEYVPVIKASKIPAASTDTYVKVLGLAGSKVAANTYVYLKGATAASTTTTTTTTVDSSKTFDAGVAMYVGLSLMSVAGSAVVIGKKKEF